MKTIQNESMMSNTYTHSPHLPPLSNTSLQEGSNSN
jgi:hypothetical protein